MCRICQLTNRDALRAIEEALTSSSGSISPAKLREIAELYPENKDVILSLSEQEISIHYNFHQSISKGHDEAESVAKDVGKDEATMLYQLLGEQAATMTLLSKKINEAIKDHEGSITSFSINPNVSQFYNELGQSMRATVKQISDLNTDINGKKDGAVEGLKALAMALGGNRTTDPKNTDEFDD